MMNSLGHMVLFACSFELLCEGNFLEVGFWD